MPLPCVKIDFVGQNYQKKELKFKYQKRAASRLFNPLGSKVST